MIHTFTLTAFDEGGKQGSPDHLRLVCNIEGGGKLAIWGNKDSHENIDTVLNAGVPCKVVCKWSKPNPEHAEKYGHTHWVGEDFPLRLL